jgi:esterase/lipase superfamily enzyme
MSGTYDMRRFLGGGMSAELYEASPVHFVPDLEGPRLEALRKRFVLLASGEGRAEDIGESWRVAQILGAKGIPNRVDSWGPDWPHDWPTWRRMLPQYLGELAG